MPDNFPPLKKFVRVTGAEDGRQQIIELPTASTSEDAATVKRLQRLTALARTQGWRSALEQVDGMQGAVDYVTSSDRLGFLPILPLEKNQHLLEIGVSLGQIAVPLAKRVKTLDGLEVVADQARFCLERARQEGLDNVRIIAGGNDCRLPYEDGVFDGVVLNLVLEWCAGRGDEDHETVQQRMLDEIARVLKPGGFFFLNTKNRYSLRLLLGGRDEHMFEMRWGSALPRWLGRFLSGRKSHPGRLHSYRQLKAMLGKAHFTRVESYWAAPEMRKPAALIPLEGPALGEARRKRRGETIQFAQSAGNNAAPAGPPGQARHAGTDISRLPLSPPGKPTM